MKCTHFQTMAIGGRRGVNLAVSAGDDADQRRLTRAVSGNTGVA
jgi:hypothetical protein